MLGWWNLVEHGGTLGGSSFQHFNSQSRAFLHGDCMFLCARVGFSNNIKNILALLSTMANILAQGTLGTA